MMASAQVVKTSVNTNNSPSQNYTVTVLLWHYMMNLHSIFCKVDVNSNKLFVLLEPHSSFRFQYRLLTMTFFETAVHVGLRACLKSAGKDISNRNLKKKTLRI